MKFLSLFIAFLILFHPLLPVAEYVMNYQYISEVLCINKEKPKLNCHGKCHLGKEMAKELGGDTQKKETSGTHSKIEIQCSAMSPSLMLGHSFNKTYTPKITFVYIEKLHTNHLANSIEYPPQSFI